MITVALVSDARYEGGAERYLVRLAAGLDRARWRPVVLLPDRDNLAELRRSLDAARVETVTWRRRPGVLGGVEVGRAVDRIGPRIVHLNLPSPYEMGCGGWSVFLSRPDRGVVATEHIADIAPSRRRVLQKRVWAGFIERTITISRAHAALLAARHGVPHDRIRVVYNGVEDPGEPRVRPDAPIRVVVVGSLEARKGQDLLLEAAGRAVGRGANLELVLVGEGPARESLIRQAEAPPLAGRVRLTGALPSAAAEIAAAHLLAMPSRIEGLPFVVAEAMAAGTVPLVSQLPGLDEIVDATVGRLLPTDNPAAWADALVELSGDHAGRQKLAAAARVRYRQRLTLERMVAGTAAVYDEVLP